jgi:crotonobetainyl-CoA:carnitine CoA-transferase CaiB-like acyl-CoA transferase
MPSPVAARSPIAKTLGRLEGRKRDEDALEARIEKWTAGQDGGVLEHALQKNGIPAHRLVSIEEFADDPQIQARNHIIELQHSLSGVSAIEASPFTLQRTPAQYLRPAPYFGRDNVEVLRDVLKLDADTIAALQQAGILT